MSGTKVKMVDNQKQSGGDHSLNIQAKSVHLGLTYSDVKSIVKDVFEANFYKLQSIAREEVNRRIEEFNEKFIRRLSQKGGQALNSAADPDMQYAIITAQREFVRSGNGELGDMLVHILTERATQQERDLTQIVLTEALQTVPKLTISQWDGLTIIWLLHQFPIPTFKNEARLKEFIVHKFEPFAADLPSEKSFILHLEYAGCGTGTTHFGGSEEYQDRFAVAVSQFMEYYSWEGIQQALQLLAPCMRDIFDFYNERGTITRLSSVGIAVAVANFTRRTGQTLDLSAYLM